MRELDAIISSYESSKKENKPVVLATVVHVAGSSYRRAGARMLVDEFGNMTGAISGGCLEGDALRKALHALHQNQNKLVTYDTSDEEDAVIGAQLGCNGVIQVLFETLDYSKPDNPIELLKSAQKSGTSVVITFFHLDRTKEQFGTVCWIDTTETIHGSVDKSLLPQLLKDAALAFLDQSSLFREYVLGSDKHYAFLEVFKSPLKLVLVGAGNDAQITSKMADMLGWEIIVTDGRPTHANNQRFVSSCKVIVSKPEEVLENVEVSDRTAFVLMTHNYNYDLEVLKLLIDQKKLRYVGVLGPKKKYERMLDEMGVNETDERLKKVYAPVGLELGAETSAEIAMSILSEIQAVVSGTKGTFLKEKNGPIHLKKNNDFKQVTID